MKYLQILLLSIFSLFFACKNDKNKANDKPFAGCKCGTPTPIFNENVPEHVAGHNFSMTKDAGVEIVKMKNGTTLQIVQTGCSDIKQEFSFVYKNKEMLTYNDAQWIQNAVSEFQKIGTFSPNFSPFVLWGNALDQYKNEFKIGEAKELDKGFFMTIDKIISGDEATMIVTVYADSCK
jgi:hypothetical protein